MYYILFSFNMNNNYNYGGKGMNPGPYDCFVVTVNR